MPGGSRGPDRPFEVLPVHAIVNAVVIIVSVIVMRMAIIIVTVFRIVIVIACYSCCCPLIFVRHDTASRREAVRRPRVMVTLCRRK